VSHAKLTRPPTEAAFLSRCGDSNRLFHDLRLITLADKDRGVIAVERFIAQLGLPLPGIENEVALQTRYSSSHCIVVQPHVEGILQIAANGIAALKDAARRYPDAILGGCRGIHVQIF